MKKKTLTLIILLATAPMLTFTSCDLILQIVLALLLEGETAFYAADFTTGKNYRVPASKLHEGEHCIVWQERGAKGSLSEEYGKKVADQYDSKIHQLLVDKFSMKEDLSYTEGTQTRTFGDMLEFANWAVGGTDGKLTILLLDIKDGWGPGKGYVAGYFWGGNFLNTEGSNGKDMIYIDTYPALDPSVYQTPPSIDTLLERSYSTLAHEGQHMVNFITSLYLLIKGGDENNRVLMDTWIDEGLASQAEYFYQEATETNKGQNFNNVSRCEYFSADEDGTIAKGNNFFIWTNDDYVLDEYATVYLFNRWLYLQAHASGSGITNKTEQDSIFMKVITSKYGDYRAVTDVAGTINSSWKGGTDKDTWANVLRTWMAANYYPSTNSGYVGDNYLTSGTGSENTGFKGIKARAIKASTISLAPGEGVYSKISTNFTPSTTGANIKYAGIKNDNNAPSTSPAYTGTILITYNANTTGTTTETGSLTNGDADPKASVVQGRAVGRSRDPYPVDPRDLMGRNRERALLTKGVLKNFKANIGTVQIELEQGQ